MRIDKRHWLMKKPIAHRGLWDENIPENSIAAFAAAAAKGYPVETDVYITKDKKIVCFHDDTLQRMTGTEGEIAELTFAELSKLKLNGTEYRIPLFDEVLAVCKGRSPILVEIKDQKDKNVVDETVAILKKFDGEFAVQSFNPLIILRVKKLAPKFIRGILAVEDPDANLNRLKKYIIKNMSLNFLIKPDFISYQHSGYPLPPRKTKNKACLAWTVTSYEIWDRVKPHVDNIIFENLSID